jgi:hypothetical protein
MSGRQASLEGDRDRSHKTEARAQTRSLAISTRKTVRLCSPKGVK